MITSEMERLTGFSGRERKKIKTVAQSVTKSLFGHIRGECYAIISTSAIIGLYETKTDILKLFDMTQDGIYRGEIEGVGGLVFGKSVVKAEDRGGDEHEFPVDRLIHISRTISLNKFCAIRAVDQDDVSHLIACALHVFMSEMSISSGNFKREITSRPKGVIWLMNRDDAEDTCYQRRLIREESIEIPDSDTDPGTPSVIWGINITTRPHLYYIDKGNGEWIKCEADRDIFTYTVPSFFDDLMVAYNGIGSILNKCKQTTGYLSLRIRPLIGPPLYIKSGFETAKKKSEENGT